MNRYAIVVVETNYVENVIIWDAPTDAAFLGCIAIELQPEERCAPGWTYQPNSNPRFIEPPTEG